MAPSPPEAFDELGYDSVSPEVTQLVELKSTGLVGTQACEDAFNVHKNAKLVRGKRRFPQPQKVFAIPISQR